MAPPLRMCLTDKLKKRSSMQYFLLSAPIQFCIIHRKCDIKYISSVFLKWFTFKYGWHGGAVVRIISQIPTSDYTWHINSTNLSVHEEFNLVPGLWIIATISIFLRNSNRSAVVADGLFENKGNQTFVAGNKDWGHNLQITESENVIKHQLTVASIHFWSLLKEITTLKLTLIDMKNTMEAPLSFNLIRYYILLSNTLVQTVTSQQVARLPWCSECVFAVDMHCPQRMIPKDLDHGPLNFQNLFQHAEATISNCT